MNAAQMPWLLVILLASAAVVRAQSPTEASATRSGGDGTVFDSGIHAFGFPVATLSAQQRRWFAVGNAFFKDNWVAAPSTAAGRDGLGPLFNARSCSACHLRDGRGRPPAAGDSAPHGLLLRLGIQTDGADAPHPIYGAQLQDRAIGQGPSEGQIGIRHEVRRGTYADGTEFELLMPRYTIVDPGFGPIGTARIGARVAPALIGLGLLEAIPTAAILARADPDDADRDGVSGRAHWVSCRRSGAPMLGRFGWKATQPTVEEQTAAAFLGDMGITSSLFPTETTTASQRRILTQPSGGEPEIDDHKLGRVTFYCQVLAVPARRDVDDSVVQRGEALFGSIGCARCHTPTHRTSASATISALRSQTIHPYTDLLLHDMGPGLADSKRDGDAAPSEWRTPPLWGIGLVPTVSGHTRYLHDGRARNLEEAILWHGGEAESSNARFRALTADERQAVLRFLESL